MGVDREIAELNRGLNADPENDSLNLRVQRFNLRVNHEVFRVVDPFRVPPSDHRDVERTLQALEVQILNMDQVSLESFVDLLIFERLNGRPFDDREMLQWWRNDLSELHTEASRLVIEEFDRRIEGMVL